MMIDPKVTLKVWTAHLNDISEMTDLDEKCAKFIDFLDPEINPHRKKDFEALILSISLDLVKNLAAEKSHALLRRLKNSEFLDKLGFFETLIQAYEKEPFNELGILNFCKVIQTDPLVAPHLGAKLIRFFRAAPKSQVGNLMATCEKNDFISRHFMTEIRETFSAYWEKEFLAKFEPVNLPLTHALFEPLEYLISFVSTEYILELMLKKSDVILLNEGLDDVIRVRYAISLAKIGLDRPNNQFNARPQNLPLFFGYFMRYLPRYSDKYNLNLTNSSSPRDSEHWPEINLNMRMTGARVELGVQLITNFVWFSPAEKWRMVTICEDYENHIKCCEYVMAVYCEPLLDLQERRVVQRTRNALKAILNFAILPLGTPPSFGRRKEIISQEKAELFLEACEVGGYFYDPRN
ncbi:unnamed protein product [Caenorhabditis angaria]|uniref:Uncharacterized protein n=1 Tax=Caenorhabditis angaria TaxID=860376 RepID=A0A9P1N3W2_9PELO|nr:unnamed protein product [Caenorhabditis angaria]